MRKIKARIVIDIATILSLIENPKDKNFLNAEKFEHILEKLKGDFEKQGASELFDTSETDPNSCPVEEDYSISASNEVEFILLSQAKLNKKGKFQKCLSPELSGIYSYGQLMSVCKALPLTRNLVEKANTIPGIFSGDKIFTQLIERTFDATTKLNQLKKQDFESFKTHLKYHTELKKCLREFSLIFELARNKFPGKLDLSTLESKLPNLIIEEKVVYSKIFAFLMEAKEYSSCLKEIPFLINPNALTALNESEDKVETLFLLSPFTEILVDSSNYYRHKIHVVKTTYAGEVCEIGLQNLTTLTDKNQFQKTHVYLDFDYTTCNNGLAMASNNPKYSVNQNLIRVLQRIQASQPNIHFQLLTSRGPWHAGIPSFLTKLSQDIFLPLKDIDSPEIRKYEKRIADIYTSLEDIRRQNLDFHSEMKQLKILFSSLDWTLDLHGLISALEIDSDRKENLLTSSLYFREKFNSIVDQMRLRCVSQVLRDCQDHFGILIEAKNEYHLGRAYEKGSFIRAQHENESTHSLILFFDDHSTELNLFYMESKTLENAKACSIRVYQDGVLSAKANQTIVEFMKKVRAIMPLSQNSQLIYNQDTDESIEMTSSQESLVEDVREELSVEI